MPLHIALFIETNPAPAKYALSVLGKCAETVRLPMVPVADKTKAAVRDAMVHAGLINALDPLMSTIRTASMRGLAARRRKARGLAALDAAPELLLRREQEVLVERIG